MPLWIFSSSGRIVASEFTPILQQLGIMMAISNQEYDLVFLFSLLILYSVVVFIGRSTEKKNLDVFLKC